MNKCAYLIVYTCCSQRGCYACASQHAHTYTYKLYHRRWIDARCQVACGVFSGSACFFGGGGDGYDVLNPDQKSALCTQ